MVQGGTAALAPLRRFVRSERAAIVTLIVAVVLARLVLLVALYLTDPTRVVRFDTAGYEAPAAALLEHGAFAQSPHRPDQPEILRTPGYPVFLAAVYGLTGGSRLAVVVLQVLVSGLTMACAYLAARTLWSHRAGMAAAALLAADPLQTYYAGVVMSETLFTFLVALGVSAAVVAVGRERLSWGLTLVAGSALAAATLVRPVGHYLPLVVGAVLAAFHRRLGLRAGHAVVLVLLVLAPTILAVGAWQVRNGQAAGVYQVSTVRSINMLYYRAAGLVALEEGTSRAQVAQRFRSEMPAGATEAELDRIRMQRGVALVVERPVGYVRLAARGAALMLLGPGDASLREYLGVEGGPARLLIVGTGLGFLAVLYFGVLVGATALARRRARADWAGLALLAGTIAYFVVVSAGGEAYSRFRTPFVPVLAILAGVGLAVATQVWRTRADVRA